MLASCAKAYKKQAQETFLGLPHSESGVVVLDRVLSLSARDVFGADDHVAEDPGLGTTHEIGQSSDDRAKLLGRERLRKLQLQGALVDVADHNGVVQQGDATLNTVLEFQTSVTALCRIDGDGD